MDYSHIRLVIAFFLVLLLLEIRFLILLKSVGLDKELCKCNGTGKAANASSRLVESRSTSLKWVASLALQRRNPSEDAKQLGPFSLFCTATVLSSTFLLSAARCFVSYQIDGILLNKLEKHPKSMFALAGTQDFTRLSLIEPIPRQILPENVVIHPAYNIKLTLPNSTRFVQNDLALIKLEEPFRLGVGVGVEIFPSCLFEFDWQAFENASLIAASFGAHDPPSSYHYRLRTTAYLKRSSTCSSLSDTFNQSSSLCVGGGNSSFFFHSGDLGGPVHFELEDRLFIVGVLSGGLSKPDRPSEVSYSTLIKPLLEWIDSNIEHERCITKEFGPLRTILLTSIIAATCSFLALYIIYLVKVTNQPEKSVN